MSKLRSKCMARLLLLATVVSPAPFAPRFYNKYFATHTSAPTPIPTPAPIVDLLAKLARIRTAAPTPDVRTLAPTPITLLILPTPPPKPQPTPSPSLSHWTLAPTRQPTPSPTPQPTTERTACDDSFVQLHGSFVKSLYLGRYDRLRVTVGGRPAFKQQAGRGEMFLFFLDDTADAHSSGLQAWTIGPKLGGAPFVLISQDNAPWPTQITGKWRELARITAEARDLSTETELNITCAPPRTASPTPNPTPGVRLPDCTTHIMIVETPADDDVDNPVKCADGGLGAGQGRYLQRGTFNQRPVYARSNGADKDKFLFYMGDPFREWVVGPLLGTPPFCLVVKSVADQPHQVEQPWRIYLANATAGTIRSVEQPLIKVTCAEVQTETDNLPPMFVKHTTLAPTASPTPVPSPSPTSLPTPSPSPAPTPERCRPGTYRISGTAGTLASCLQCPEGKYAVGWDSAECAECVGCGPGFSWGGCGPFSKDLCTACAAGQFNPAKDIHTETRVFIDAQDDEEAEKKAEALSRKVLFRNWNKGRKHKRCRGCPSGKYQPRSGQSQCADCKWSTTVGSKVCKAKCPAQCGAGKYLHSCKCSMVLVADAADHVRRLGSQIPSIRASAAAQFKRKCVGTCALCPVGQTSVASAHGKPEIMNVACTPCGTGMHQPVRGGPCIACPACDAGYFRVGCRHDNLGKCEGCEAGRFKPAGQLSVMKCYLCAPGRFQPLGGQEKCRRCPIHTPVSAAGGKTCQRTCSSGSYLSVPQRCTYCPHGKHRREKTQEHRVGKVTANISTRKGGAEPTPTQHESCNICAAGRYSFAGQGRCDGCPAFCPAGKFNVECGTNGMWGQCQKRMPHKRKKKRKKTATFGQDPLAAVHNTWFLAFAHNYDNHAARASSEHAAKEAVTKADASATWAAGGEAN